MATNLCYLESNAKFQQSYERTVNQILACDNCFYVSETDQKELAPKRNPLERNMLRYLLMFDPVMQQLKHKHQQPNMKVFSRLFLIGFGLLQLTTEQLKELSDDLQAFHDHAGEAIFVLFIGALNHWVTLVVQKTSEVVKLDQEGRDFQQKLGNVLACRDLNAKPERPVRGLARGNSLRTTAGKAPTLRKDTVHFYFLDSFNLEHLWVSDREVPALFLKRVSESKQAGLKVTNEFMLKMNLQSVFDIRRSLVILQDVFLNKTPIQYYAAQVSLHNKLRRFHAATLEQQDYFVKNFERIQLERKEAMKSLNMVSSAYKESSEDSEEEPPAP